MVATAKDVLTKLLQNTRQIFEYCFSYHNCIKTLTKNNIINAVEICMLSFALLIEIKKVQYAFIVCHIK